MNTITVPNSGSDIYEIALVDPTRNMTDDPDGQGLDRVGKLNASGTHAP